MAKVFVQNLTVTETAGDHLTANFPLFVLADRDVRGMVAYKTVVSTPSWARLIPNLDDLDEIILPEQFNETIAIELSVVQDG